MKNYPYIPNMVQAITVLTVLKMMTKAQTSCGSGSMNGKVMYERLPNIQLQGFDDDIFRDTGPPFVVLEKCQDLCLRDRSTQNIVRACHSFDFQPGSRLANYNGSPEYEESTCYLTQEQSRPDGLGSLMMVPNSVHFTEICLTSNRPERECPNRRYVFERHPRKKLKLAAPDVKESRASNRTACEDLCLNEFSFVCRSATFDAAMGICALSRFTRRTHPELLEDDIDSDYLENTCLNAERRCDGLAVFIKEENKRLGGPFEVDMFTNLTLDECQGMCVRAEKYLCRSIEYDEVTKQCTLSEEDSVSQKEDLGVASSPTHNFYDFVCLDSPRGSEYPDNSVTSHLFTGKKPDTAFQRYRNSRLGGEHHSEISGRSLSECLDECLRQPSFQCRSAEYSERYRTCRLTRYNQRDGMRIIYDADYDYYENLMLGGDGDSGTTGGTRPGDNSVYGPGDNRYPGGGTYRPGGGGSGSRYPPSGGGRYPVTSGSRYPPSSGGYDYDRYPGAGGRPPYYDRYPNPDYDDRYAPDDRYPQRYPPVRRPPPVGTDDRYAPVYPPSSGGSSYHPGRLPPTRYDDDRYGDRYSGSNRYDDRYSGGGTRYDDRYSGVGTRYDDRYNGVGDRYNGVGGTRYDDRDRYNGVSGTRYDDRDRYGSGTRYGSNGIGYGSRYGGTTDDKYSGGRYGNRYGDRYDRYNDRYGDRATTNRYDYYGGGGGGIGDRYGGIGGDRYGGIGGYRGGVGGGHFNSYRPPFGRPVDPYRPPYDDLGPRPPVHRPLSPGPDGPIYDSFGGLGPARPFASRCDDGDAFKQSGTRLRMRKDYIRRGVAVPSLTRCQQECVDARDFTCRSFNYRDGPYEGENCELSDRDTRDMDMGNPQYFDSTNNYDFYERHGGGRTGIDGECLDVSQVCNEDGMEFTLRTPEGFYGRIYAYGFYDRCFFRGNGGTVNVLRISGMHGYPECGTQRYGDSMTNIVVVQFSDYVQTGRDKRFNLTCLFRGPGEAVVSSGFIGAGSGSPIPIEYLPAENTLSSKVRLLILYQGRPTTTIAVGDPLTFRIEAQDGHNYATDIFATNVVARDPYSGRSVQLIDRFGCPVDSFVFPELDKGRNGDTLEARFNAFKIPESNFLVFEATVRTCRDGCQPAYCQSGTGRSEPSFGRRRRSIDVTMTSPKNSTNNGTEIEGAKDESTNEIDRSDEDSEMTVSFPKIKNEVDEGAVKLKNEDRSEEDEEEEKEESEYVREMIEVFDSREEMRQEARRAEPVPETVCLSPGEYRGLVGVVLSLVAAVLTGALLGGLAYRKYWLVMRKNMSADRFSHSNFSATTASSGSYPNTRSSAITSGFSSFGAALQRQLPSFGIPPTLAPPPRPCSSSMASLDPEIPCAAPGGPFEDPSEPIYTDPSLFERARSLRSVAVSPKRRRSPAH